MLMMIITSVNARIHFTILNKNFRNEGFSFESERSRSSRTTLSNLHICAPRRIRTIDCCLGKYESERK